MQIFANLEIVSCFLPVLTTFQTGKFLYFWIDTSDSDISALFGFWDGKQITFLAGEKNHKNTFKMATVPTTFSVSLFNMQFKICQKCWIAHVSGHNSSICWQRRRNLSSQHVTENKKDYKKHPPRSSSPVGCLPWFHGRIHENSLTVAATTESRPTGTPSFVNIICRLFVGSYKICLAHECLTLKDNANRFQSYLGILQFYPGTKWFFCRTNAQVF